MFDAKTIKAISNIAKELDISAAALLAVAEVESAGRVSARVRGRLEPVIRFEGHYFDRHLRGDSRMEAREEGLANPRAGFVKNPRSQVERWKLLNRAIRINRIAALSSVSWGLGQVMGSHWQWLGYGSVDALVAEARSGTAGQVALMVRYIKKAGLVAALKEQDWIAFARTYNGPSFHKNRYDTKMADAFARWAKKLGKGNTIIKSLPAILPEKVEQTDDDRLMFGSRGRDVKVLQNALTKRGYVLVADGLFGLITDRVVRQFQRDHMIPENGIVGDAERKLVFGSQLQLGRHARQLKMEIALKASTAAKTARKRYAKARNSLKRRIRQSLLSISRRIA